MPVTDHAQGAHGWSEPGGGLYRAQFFGPFRVTRTDLPAWQSVWPRAGARKLLQWFLLNPLQPCTSTALCEVLWPGRTGTHRPKQLHVILHCLRQSLEPDPGAGQPFAFIHTDRHGRYRFEPAGRWCTDLDEVEQLLRDASSARSAGQSAVAINRYQQALGYYERKFLPEEIYEDAFAAHRAIHERRYLGVLHELLRLYLDHGHHFEAEQCASTLLDNDPYSESAIMAIAQVNLRQGNSAVAGIALDRFITSIESELRTVPSRQLLELRSRTRQAG